MKSYFVLIVITIKGACFKEVYKDNFWTKDDTFRKF